MKTFTTEKNGYKFEIIESEMSENDKKWFQNQWEGWELTGYSVKIYYPEGSGMVSETRPIFKGGRFTPYGMARITKNKIVIACWDRYKSIDLKTHEINFDDDDVK